MGGRMRKSTGAGTRAAPLAAWTAALTLLFGRGAAAASLADLETGTLVSAGVAILALGLAVGLWLGRRSAAAPGSGTLAQPLAALLEDAPVGCYAADPAGRVYYMNSTLQLWLGLQPEDLQARRVRLHDLAVEPPEGAQPHSFFVEPGKDRGEIALKDTAGRPVMAFLQQTLSARRIGAGPAALGVVHNLTQAREFEAAMRRFEQRFQRFFEQAPLGVALVDPAGHIEVTNEAFRDMVGPESEALKDGQLYDLIAEPDRQAVREKLAAVARDADGADQPLDILLAGAGKRSATLYAVRREAEGGGPAGLILQLIDTTERRKLERQFAQSQKMQAVGQLAGGIAHDFNNLLTAMIGFCDLLLLRHRAGDQSFADIMQIKQNANRAANLVRQLLAFSRQQTLIPRVLDVTDVLAELSHLLRRLIGANIELQMVHGRDLYPVKVDHGQLEQVIINLAVNARDAMPEGGRLTIRTTNVTNPGQTVRGGEVMPAGDYVRIEVQDSGTGIPVNVIEHIFEPFFSTKEVGAGTGLGLATVYGIVKQTGGFIFVESRVGEGSSFSIYLPRHAAVAAEPALRKAGDGAARDLTGIGTVLLVEDEDAVRLFGARALRNKGYNVFEARSGEAALEILKGGKQPVDLLITDVVMPRMDGPSLIREVRQFRPDLKVIFISGYAEEDFRKRLDEGSEIHFLAKPFSLAQLAEKVKEVMHDQAA
jgi:two-component system, cell cycle sensor histidine kinase and response regulator CckA